MLHLRNEKQHPPHKKNPKNKKEKQNKTKNKTKQKRKRKKKRCKRTDVYDIEYKLHRYSILTINKTIISLPCLQDFEFADDYLQKDKTTPPKKKKKKKVFRIGYQTASDSEVSVLECGVFLHCHYSQVHSNPIFL